MTRSIHISCLSVLAVLLTGCQSAPGNTGSAYQLQEEHTRNPLRAQELTLEAADLIESDPAEAESLLRDALVADLFHGPAHNNLGILYLQQGKLYEAANEFEWARKLMPGHPDPRINLALVLERGGQIDEAMASYESALEVYPDHIAAMQGLVRLQFRHDRIDDRTEDFLREVALRGENITWREWALRNQTHAQPMP